MTSPRQGLALLPAAAVLIVLAAPRVASAQDAIRQESLATTGADVKDNERCEGEACWGRKRRIQVVQVKEFKKDGRLELGLLAGIIPNDPFALYAATGLRASYYVSESLAIGGTLVLPIRRDTGLSDDIFDEYTTIDSSQALDQTLLYHVNVLEWTPLVGKMAFYSIGTVHMDVGLSAGFGLLHTEAPKINLSGGRSADVFPDQKFLFTTGGGMRFYGSEWFAVRFDVSQYFYQKPDALGGGLSHPTMISLGISTFLPFSPGGA